jgi:prepilin-type N-terminal cleavage/methylation domain-containing protein
MKTINIKTIRKQTQPIQRQGFTLVELLVSMAIIIFMLSIMSQAFVIATTCMQGMKTVGELIDKVRPVMTIMQRDLAADHFDGTKKLCDSDFWEYGPPREGYFSVFQYNFSEQETPISGAGSVKYYISNSISNHALTFTSRLPGKNPTEFYTAEYPTAHKARMNGIYNYPNAFSSNIDYMKVQNARRFDFISDIIHCKWAEIAYFIKKNDSVVPKDPAGTSVDLPLHDLYRQQRVILPDVSDMNKAGITNASPDPFNLFSHYVDSAGKVVFNQPSDVTAPWKRFGNRGAAPAALPNFKAYADPTGQNDVGNNSDLVLTNVISFDVRIINDSNLDFLNLVAPMAEAAISGVPVVSGGQVISIPVTFGGKNYLFSNPPRVKIFAAPGDFGVGATAIANIQSGVVVGINITNPGTGYTSPPNVIIYNDALSEYQKINTPNYYNYTVTNTFAIFDTWTMERSQDPSKNYDLGNFSAGPWQPATGLSGAYQVPFWNGITNKGIKINAIQITIRVWDDKSSQARDFVLIQKI